MSGESGVSGWLWLLLALLAVAAGAFLYLRSRKRSDWTAQSVALEAETRTAATLQLPPVLAQPDAGVRMVGWPPLRATLVALAPRWTALTEGAPDEAAKARGLQVAELLGSLVVAIDSETEALTQGRDWSLLRPRVEEIQAALVGQLNGPGPSPA